MTIIILYIVFVSAYLILIGKGKIGIGFYHRVNDYNFMVLMLLAWIIIGFFFNLDYNDRWGCIVTHQPIFNKHNIIFSASALIFTILGRISKKALLKRSIHIIELIFWITRLMIYKGGYAVGFTGSPADTIVIYDFITLLLRLIVIRNTGIKIRALYLSIVALIIILIKIFVFPTQQTINWEYEESLENSKLTIENMQGSWIGVSIIEEYVNDTVTGNIDSIEAEKKLIYMISKDTLIDKKLVRSYYSANVKIDSNQIEILRNGTQEKYLMIFNSEFSATMFSILPDSIGADSALMKDCNTDLRIRRDWIDNSELYIMRIDNDSLIFNEGFLTPDFRYKLTRKTQANNKYKSAG
jgi:hypothetical protein